MGRIAGEPGQFPFGDREKDALFSLLQQLTAFYTANLLSFVVMGNHWHLVCAVRPEVPNIEEIKHRYRAFYGDRRAEPDWNNPAVVAPIAARMRDMSRLIKDLQQRFTCWFNRCRPQKRRGTLWAGRFKSVILDGQQALWECLKYVEMNPVRAGLCAQPADYAFSTWGRLRATGRHPFAESFFPHLRRYLGERANAWSDDQIAAELDADMARVCAAERRVPSQDPNRAAEESRQTVPFELALTRRVRHWSDGGIIGSVLFVRDQATRLFSPDRARRQQISPGKPSPGSGLTDAAAACAGFRQPATLCAFRRLRTPQT
jgi:REP element-mobilizing transposase RayT